MFFIFGISQGEKKLDFQQTAVCACCGGYGRYEVYMTYMYFSLFFIPIIRWKKQYFVTTACCGAVSEIDRELGERIQKGQVNEIRESDLHFDCHGDTIKRCGNCGYETGEDFQYCPKCGGPL